MLVALLKVTWRSRLRTLQTVKIVLHSIHLFDIVLCTLIRVRTIKRYPMCVYLRKTKCEPPISVSECSDVNFHFRIFNSGILPILVSQVTLALGKVLFNHNPGFHGNQKLSHQWVDNSPKHWHPKQDLPFLINVLSDSNWFARLWWLLETDHSNSVLWAPFGLFL